MKIAILNDDFPPFARGGSSAVAFSLAKGLKEAGHEVFAITTVREAAQAGEAEVGGVKVHRLASRYPGRLRSWFSLHNPQTIPAVAAILRRERPDVVHAHNLHEHLSFACLTAAKRSGARVFLTAHDAMLFHYGKLDEFIDRSDPRCDPHPDYRVSAWRQIRAHGLLYNPFRNGFIRRRLQDVDGLFAVSAALKEALEQNGIHGGEVVHNGIDASRWNARPGEAEAFIGRYGLRGRKIVLCSGRMSAMKGRDVLLGVMRIVRKKIPEAVLVVGGGKGFDRRASSPADDAVFTDWMPPEGMRAALHAASVAVVPSLYLDPFPTAALEAMACGKPVVGTCFGGTKESVIDGVTGLIVNPFDAEATAGRIIELLMDTEKAARMGAAGLERVRSDFSLERQVQATLRRYQVSSDNSRTGS